jgi:hypothetical protein
MSDSAFKSAPYSGYTNAELAKFINDANTSVYNVAKMRAELERRQQVAQGNVSVMTDGERLRHVRKSAVSNK